jgi:hypothetical protein
MSKYPNGHEDLRIILNRLHDVVRHLNDAGSVAFHVERETYEPHTTSAKRIGDAIDNALQEAEGLIDTATHDYWEAVGATRAANGD